MMTLSHSRRSTKASADPAKKPDNVRSPHIPRVGGDSSAGDATRHVPKAPVQTRADVERLMGQLREANERLMLAAVRAQDRSDEAHLEVAQAKIELDDRMRQLQDANESLAAATMHAHAMAEEATQHEEEYRRLSGRLLQLQDDERRRLAADLHDSTGQRLAALVMNLDLLERAGEALGARSRQVLMESRLLAEQCAQEVRTMAYLLHPPLFEEMGLVKAVRWYVSGFMKRSGMQVVMTLDEIGRLPMPIEMALFRVIQESLTNVHRHASVSTASIRLTKTANAVLLTIQDRGRGRRDDLTEQNDAHVPATLGVGIQGMRERIRQFGGTFDVEFTDKGTTVRVSVPLGKAAL
jgi:signal transduction histidine kinase